MDFHFVLGRRVGAEFHVIEPAQYPFLAHSYRTQNSNIIKCNGNGIGPFYLQHLVFLSSKAILISHVRLLSSKPSSSSIKVTSMFSGTAPLSRERTLLVTLLATYSKLLVHNYSGQLTLL